MAAAYPAPPPIGPDRPVAAVPDGDLAAGLVGWGAVGPSMTLIAGPLIQAADNTTVLSPPVTVPPSGQVLAIVLGVPGANAMVDIRARPVDGGADIPLATIVPRRAVQEWRVGVGGIRGRTVRIVIDPVTSLGRRMLVRSVGPVYEVLPGWEVSRGLPVVSDLWGRAGVVVDGGVLDMRTPRVTVPRGTGHLGMVVRGTGRVRASAAGHVATATASTGRWTALHVPVPVHGGALRVSVSAIPGEGARLVVADIATPVRPVRVARVSVRGSGTGSVVVAIVGTVATGMQGEVRIGARVVGRGTVRADGRLVIRARGEGVARVVLRADAGRSGARARVVLPAAAGTPGS